MDQISLLRIGWTCPGMDIGDDLRRHYDETLALHSKNISITMKIHDTLLRT
jgi:hypothetical protein